MLRPQTALEDAVGVCRVYSGAGLSMHSSNNNSTTDNNPHSHKEQSFGVGVSLKHEA